MGLIIHAGESLELSLHAFRVEYGLGRETYLVSKSRKSCLSWVWLNTIEMGRKTLN